MQITDWMRFADAIDDCSIVYDNKLNIQHTNKAALSFLKLTEDKLLGREITRFFTHRSKDESITRIIFKQNNETAELLFSNNSYSRIVQKTIRVSIKQLHLEKNDYYLASFKQFEKASIDLQSVIETAQKYSNTLLDTVLDGLITINKEGTVQEFNKSAERIFGYTAQEVKGQNVKLLMPDPYHSEHDQYLNNYHLTKEKKVIGLGRHVKAKRKDGTIFPIELGVNEMNVGGKITYVGTIRDITERVTAEKEIQNYIQALKLSNQELDQFAYIASHDLKEPLRGLAANATFLREDYDSLFDDAGKKRLKRIQFLCTRMEELVSSLLYYSRLGRQELAVEYTDIGSIIEKIKELTVPEESDDIVINFAENLPTILCDIPRTTELFRNLISNSIKYNKSDTKIIEIGTKEMPLPNGGKIKNVFFVKDNGIGIDPKYFTDIFKIFKRLNEEDDDKRGTGVGLTFVKKIVERHNGTIWLDSDLNIGTTFYFTLCLEENI